MRLTYINVRNVDLNLINMETETKMTKEDYLRKKGLLPSEPLGKIFTFKSTRKGVEEILEHQIWEKRICSHRIDGDKRIPIIEYKIKEAPFECEITEGDTIGEDRGCGSGMGDLWSWTYFCSLDKYALEEARDIEA